MVEGLPMVYHRLGLSQLLNKIAFSLVSLLTTCQKLLRSHTVYLCWKKNSRLVLQQIHSLCIERIHKKPMDDFSLFSCGGTLE